MVYTTLNKIIVHFPSAEDWEKLLGTLGKRRADNEPLALTTILDIAGLDFALWCFRSLPEHNRQWRLLAVRFARSVQHLMGDERSLRALDVAEAWGKGNATHAELTAARKDADAAAEALWDTAAIEVAASWGMARDKVAEAWAPAWAARAAADATASGASLAARDAASASAAASEESEQAKQSEIFRDFVSELEG